MAMGPGTTLLGRGSRFTPVVQRSGGAIPMQPGLGSRPRRRKSGLAFSGIPIRLLATTRNDAFMVFDSLIGWATNNKANARVGFFPGPVGQGAIDIRDRLVAAGHTVTDIPDVVSLPAADQLDLLIHSNELAPDPPVAFISYDVPVIAFNSLNHDDTGIIRVSDPIAFTNPVSINVVAANAGHPALGGKTGTINWTNFGFTMQGMGPEHSGGKVLARVTTPTGTSAALYVIEEGGALLGGYSWDPEGDRYVVGADLDFTFGGGPPRQLNIPVNLAGRTNVELTVALAATDADFETGNAGAGTADYLAILFDPDGSGNFTLLSEFTGNPAKSYEEVQIENGARVLDVNGNAIFTGNVLSNQSFKDYKVNLPAGTANSVIRFESLSTFVNEIVALDDVRVAVKTAPLTGDFNGNGAVDAADYVLWRNGGPLQNDPTEGVQPGDYNVWRSNFGRTAGAASAAAASVPEPTALVLMWFAAVVMPLRQNRN